MTIRNLSEVETTAITGGNCNPANGDGCAAQAIALAFFSPEKSEKVTDGDDGGKMSKQY
ncbi:hypothetical protein [Luteimonas aestuarii]|uniref:hypothetical protein n=1 Tax=Luteimonas aestuarii TaxID=453837 RepID=UPI001404BA18|nr:hypothetical protein [Luteimonas aestuarii]